MSCWIFVMAGNESEFLERVKTKEWPIYKGTINRMRIDKEDKILFYLAGPHRQKIVADAVINSELKEAGEKFVVNISKINLWKKQVPIKMLVKSLEFIKNKEKWGVFMQGGIVKITDNDYSIITEAS